MWNGPPSKWSSIGGSDQENPKCPKPDILHKRVCWGDPEWRTSEGRKSCAEPPSEEEPTMTIAAYLRISLLAIFHSLELQIQFLIQIQIEFKYGFHGRFICGEFHQMIQSRWSAKAACDKEIRNVRSNRCSVSAIAGGIQNDGGRKSCMKGRSGRKLKMAVTGCLKMTLWAPFKVVVY